MQKESKNVAGGVCGRLHAHGLPPRQCLVFLMLPPGPTLCGLSHVPPHIPPPPVAQATLAQPDSSRNDSSSLELEPKPQQLPAMDSYLNIRW